MSALTNTDFLEILHSIMKRGLACSNVDDRSKIMENEWLDEYDDYRIKTVLPRPWAWDSIVECLDETTADEIMAEALESVLVANEENKSSEELFENEEVRDEVYVLLEHNSDFQEKWQADDRFAILGSYYWPVHLTPDVDEQEVANQLHMLAPNLVLVHQTDSDDNEKYFAATCSGTSLAHELVIAYLIAHQIPPVSLLTARETLNQCDAMWHPLIQHATEEMISNLEYQKQSMCELKERIITDAKKRGDTDDYWAVQRLVEMQGGFKLW